MSWIAPGCLLFTGFFTWLLGLASIGLWVGCYFECPTGRDTEFNYYVAVWTGAVAFFTGMFHMVFCCGKRRQFNNAILRGAACCSFILLPCALLCTTLSGYLSWREWDTEQRYQEELNEGNDPEQLQGDYVTGIALFATMAAVGALLLILTLIFNCYHCCGNSDSDEEEVEISIEPMLHEENPRGYSSRNGARSYSSGHYNPPSPELMRESNTFRGPRNNFKYGNTSHGNATHDRDYYGKQERFGNYRDYNYRRSSPSANGTYNYGRSSPSANANYDFRQQPASSSHPPANHLNQSYRVTTTRNHNHNRQNHRYNYGSHPGRLRWEDGSAQEAPRENPWSFGSREDVGSTRIHHSNYY